MTEPFDVFHYISYLRSRWRWIGGSVLVAVAIAAAVSATLPRQYTATAQIVIEPPAGSDLRAAMAVSPIYLESLKTYEHFANSDSLFQRAIDKFNLRGSFGARPIESIKKRVVQVSIVRNTRILEIAATLRNPQQAQGLAKYLADSTVELNRSTVNEGDRDLVQGIEQQQKEIREELDRVDASWARLLSEEPVADLQNAMGKSSELRTTLQQQMLNTQLELADAADRQKAGSVEASEARKEASNATARLEEMRKQLQDLDRQSRDRELLLAVRMAHRDRLQAEQKAAQTALAAIEARLREARGDSGYRGERLKVIDPGVVPERPSSPNVPLNLAAAFLLGLALPILYLTLVMSYREHEASGRRDVLHALTRARDD